MLFWLSHEYTLFVKLCVLCYSKYCNYFSISTTTTATTDPYGSIVTTININSQLIILYYFYCIIVLGKTIFIAKVGGKKNVFSPWKSHLWWASLLCIVGELEGGGSLAVAVGVGVTCHVSCVTWHLACAMWHVTRNIWHVTHDMCKYSFGG